MHRVVVTDLNLTFRLKRFPAAAEACEALDFIILLPCRFWALVLFFTESCGLSSVSLLLALDLFTTFAPLVAKVKVLEHLALPIFTALLHQIKETQGWTMLWHISKDYCGQSDWTEARANNNKNNNNNNKLWKSGLLGFFFCFWASRIFEIGRNATYT